MKQEIIGVPQTTVKVCLLSDLLKSPLAVIPCSNEVSLSFTSLTTLYCFSEKWFAFYCYIEFLSILTVFFIL